MPVSPNTSFLNDMTQHHYLSAHCAPIFVNKKTKTSEKIFFKQSRSPLLGVRWSTSAGFSASTRPSVGAGRRFPRALEWDSGLVLTSAGAGGLTD